MSTVLSRPGSRQFSLFTALLLALVACVIAAFVGERLRRRAAERKLAADAIAPVSGGVTNIRQRQRTKIPPSKLDQVHIQAQSPAMGARDEPGWSWRVNLPPSQNWWLYISQGEVWDENLGRYRDAVSGSRIADEGDLGIAGCISYDHEGGRWIQNWIFTAKQSMQCAQLSEEGLAALRAAGKATRTVTGETNQATLPIRPNPHGRIQLLRWHKVLDPPMTIQSPTGGERTLKEYGFSIYLVEETPVPPNMTRPDKIAPEADLTPAVEK
jgi:hypothetical protein